MKSIDEIYKEVENDIYSDIYQHIPILYSYTLGCKHITEFGTGGATSTWAFLKSRPDKVISYDIAKQEERINECIEICKNENVNFQFKEESSIAHEIELTDLLFIDSLHTYTHCKKELEIQSGKVNKYIILHDTVSFGQRGEDGKEPGLIKAISEFLEKNKRWTIEKVYENQNGLIVLKRIL